MSASRFPWSRAGKLACCIELKSRRIIRKLNEDSRVNCLACGRKPDKNDRCYYPTEHISTQTNKIIGHEECVDREVEKAQAKASSAWFEAVAFVDKFHGRTTAPKAAGQVKQNGANRDMRHVDITRRKLEGVIANPTLLPTTSREQAKSDAERIKNLLKEHLDKSEFDKGFAAGYSSAWNEISELL